jgi:hypothetical protein
MIQALPT